MASGFGRWSRQGVGGGVSTMRWSGDLGTAALRASTKRTCQVVRGVDREPWEPKPVADSPNSVDIGIPGTAVGLIIRPSP